MRILIHTLAAFLLLILLAPAKVRAGEVVVLSLADQTINPVTADYIDGGLETAARLDAAAVVILLDTPGGLLTSTRQIVRSILSSGIPVIVYVAPSGARAGSAGVFITYASHLAAMAPSTHIGAAHPVSVGGGDSSSRTVWDAIRDFLDRMNHPESSEKNPSGEDAVSTPMDEKILHDTVAFIRSLARDHGRNEAWAEESVTKSSSITAAEAIEKGVVEILASDLEDLLEQVHGREVTAGGRVVTFDTLGAGVRNVGMTVRQRILNILANPNISYMLLMLGFYGLLFEVTHPGIGVPGVLGVIFLILGLYSMQMLPTNYAGLGLLVLGLLLLGAEALLPGFGLLALGGTVCLMLGSLFLFRTSSEVMRVSYSLVLGFSFATAALTFFLVGAAVRTAKQKVRTGSEGLVGSVGRLEEPVSQEQQGRIFVHGELWNATAPEPLAAGTKVRVMRVEGLTLHVSKLEEREQC